MEEQYERLKQALIAIRDFDPGHCRGDQACAMENSLENVDQRIEDVADLLS